MSPFDSCFDSLFAHCDGARPMGIVMYEMLFEESDEFGKSPAWVYSRRVRRFQMIARALRRLEAVRKRTPTNLSKIRMRPLYSFILQKS